METPSTITYDDFSKVDIRLGTVVRAESFPEARKPAIKLWVDFGAEVGTKQTSAQVTVHYTPEALIGRRVWGVVNFPVKKIAGFNSEFLVLGAVSFAQGVRLAMIDGDDVADGARLH